MGRLTHALTCALFTLVAMPSAASAHTLEFGTLRLTVADGTVDAHFAYRGRGPVAGDLEVVWPEGCTPTAPPRGAWGDEGYDLEATLACDALEGRDVGVRGLFERRGSVLVEVYEADDDASPILLAHLEGERATDRLTPTESALPTVAQYFWLGIEHLALGIDHLLFVLGLLLLVRTGRDLVRAITAFTLGHSITLGIAALGIADAPSAPTEFCIALSLALVAREALSEEPSLTRERPELTSALFGLVHGLGFASALGDLGLPTGRALPALFLFNAGIEIGQLIFVAVIFALGAALAKLGLSLRAGTRPAAYAIGGASMMMLIERAPAVFFGA